MTSSRSSSSTTGPRSWATTSSRPLLAVDAGLVTYADGLRLQRDLAAARTQGQTGDLLLTLEHPPVYTAGRRADVAAHVRSDAQIRLVRTDRGGDVTYHGPGQLLVYPILRLDHAKAVRPYVEALQSACIATAASFGVHAGRDPRNTGVWVGNDKLVAIGIRVRGRVTTHGLAFNVDPNLSHFAGIVPCGLRDAGVCSLASLGVDTTVTEVSKRLVVQLGNAFDRPVIFARPTDLGLPALVSDA